MGLRNTVYSSEHFLRKTFSLLLEQLFLWAKCVPSEFPHPQHDTKDRHFLSGYHFISSGPLACEAFLPGHIPSHSLIYLSWKMCFDSFLNWSFILMLLKLLSLRTKRDSKVCWHVPISKPCFSSWKHWHFYDYELFHINSSGLEWLLRVTSRRKKLFLLPHMLP